MEITNKATNLKYNYLIGWGHQIEMVGSNAASTPYLLAVQKIQLSPPTRDLNNWYNDNRNIN